MVKNLRSTLHWTPRVSAQKQYYFIWLQIILFWWCICSEGKCHSGFFVFLYLLYCVHQWHNVCSKGKSLPCLTLPLSINTNSFLPLKVTKSSVWYKMSCLTPIPEEWQRAPSRTELSHCKSLPGKPGTLHHLCDHWDPRGCLKMHWDQQLGKTYLPPVNILQLNQRQCLIMLVPYSSDSSPKTKGHWSPVYISKSDWWNQVINSN